MVSGVAAYEYSLLAATTAAVNGMATTKWINATEFDLVVIW
jgi:hypothetical protein